MSEESCQEECKYNDSDGCLLLKTKALRWPDNASCMEDVFALEREQIFN